jgi:hypothetical protein
MFMRGGRENDPLVTVLAAWFRVRGGTATSVTSHRARPIRVLLSILAQAVVRLCAVGSEGMCPS